MNRKSFTLAFLFFGLFANFAFGVDGFSDIETTLKEGSDTGQISLGIILKWAFAVVLPLICMVGSAIYGFMQTKQKLDSQNQGGAWKLALSTAGYAILGGFAFYLVASLFSLVLFGDFGKITDIINEFYLQSVQ